MGVSRGGHRSAITRRYFTILGFLRAQWDLSLSFVSFPNIAPSPGCGLQCTVYLLLLLLRLLSLHAVPSQCCFQVCPDLQGQAELLPSIPCFSAFALSLLLSGTQVFLVTGRKLIHSIP